MTKNAPRNKALARAVELARGQARLARAIAEITGDDIKQGHVWSWLFKTGKVHSSYVIATAQAVGWQVTPHELDPGVYPHPDDGLPDELRGQPQKKVA